MAAGKDAATVRTAMHACSVINAADGTRNGNAPHDKQPRRAATIAFGLRLTPPRHRLIVTQVLPCLTVVTT
jgi:hypothetical protein